MLPLLMVRPARITVGPLVVPLETWKTRLLLLPLIVIPAAGPVIVMLRPIASSPLVSVTVPVTEKLIVSLSTEAAIVSRSEPEPLSLRFMTVRVVASTGEAPASSTIAPQSHIPNLRLDIFITKFLLT